MTIEKTNLFFKRKSKLPMIFQSEMAECGHACIAMVCNYWGHNIDLYSIRKISKPSNKGVTLLNITNILEKFGFKTRALKVPLEELQLIKCPAIIHWNMNHFVVLKEVKKNIIVINDPGSGVRHCTMEEFSNSFTGVVLETEKTTDFSAISEKRKISLSDLVKSVSGINRFLIWLLSLSLVIEFLGLLNPLFIQYVTDDVLVFSDINNLYVIASAFFILLFFQIFTEYVRGNMVVYLTNNLTEQFSSNVVKHILKLPLNFFEVRYKGDIQSRFQSIDHIQKKLSTDFINTVLDGIMIIINLFVMMIYSSVLTMLVVFFLFIYFFIRYFSYRFLKKYTESSILQHAKASSIFLETIQSILPIKTFSKEKIRFNTWRNCYINALNENVKISKIDLYYNIANQFLFNFEYIIVICVGASLVLGNKFSIGMLMAFLTYRNLLVSKSSSFIKNIFDYKLISIQLNRLSDILFQQPEKMEKEELRLPVTEAGVMGALTLCNISFKYNSEEKYILKNINLKINAGEKVVLIGSSGCGKSTLMKVLMGLLNKTEGEIYIDDTLIDDFGLKNYRDITASVMQEDTLLNGSILDNISFFDENLDIEHVYQVAKLSFIHETIKRLPMGYETRVGEMGSMLSGGQKQRILLARALYKKPKILFLDEATSHLDGENEKNINISLRSLNITQVIIAHRKETINMADKIIELEKINSIN
ncbi:peptidase domain-containing ABC transporter [Legionella fairfieldensis]|uniref:peptidase domain-containing ABC transporter n=1 Tax=Legionella fairfieldensis TaxID=45064 RepID=UPI00048B84B2|nr:peptidase domain-containing ABC transporter [Legionella fairfieldensis]